MLVGFVYRGFRVIWCFGFWSFVSRVCVEGHLGVFIGLVMRIGPGACGWFSFWSGGDSGF